MSLPPQTYLNTYFGRKYIDGKKITWRDGFSAIRCILKYNLLK